MVGAGRNPVTVGVAMISTGSGTEVGGARVGAAAGGGATAGVTPEPGARGGAAGDGTGVETSGEVWGAGRATTPRASASVNMPASTSTAQICHAERVLLRNRKTDLERT